MIDEKKLIEGIEIEAQALEEKEEKYYKGKIAGLRTAEALAKLLPKIGEWIPCSERLPNKDEYLKNDGRFIVTDGNRRYQSHYDIYDGNFKTVRNIIGNTCDFSIDNCVIAWQPIPDAYIVKHKEREENE